MITERLAAIGAVIWWLLALAVLLLASLIGNAVLLKRVWTSNAECRAATAQAATTALRDEWERQAKLERRGEQITRDTRAETARDTTQAQGSTDARDAKIRTVVVHGDCRMPDGLPSLQPAINEANSAAR